jgi:hypothetical protein
MFILLAEQNDKFEFEVLLLRRSHRRCCRWDMPQAMTSARRQCRRTWRSRGVATSAALAADPSS